MYQVIAYNLFANVFALITYTAISPIASYLHGDVDDMLTLLHLLLHKFFMKTQLLHLLLPIELLHCFSVVRLQILLLL
ncbi:hypothetical protein PsorP6_005120 [Peronosclerospora sorghi]|uniref:Uncharacterized protein n=1 Tax=Peronosclerospora sorghi TaxID=230839 RepID=A0ACC0W4L0_9STRA|nr:hypothetical protein PsorP6_005120 [Peronosclerospora sorghi]